MNIAPKKKIVLLGMMTKIPVPGVVWQNIHYLIGFQRLGYEIYYIEQHARTPSMFMETEQCDGSGKAAAFLSRVMDQFNLADRWCYHALHENGQYFGLSQTRVRELFDSAELIINLHGGTEPLPEHAATGRLIYIQTDPVQLEIELHKNRQRTIDFLTPHVAFFTFGENLGAPDCRLPVNERFKFVPTRQPVVLDFWQTDDAVPAQHFTTVGTWRQPWRNVWFKRRKYGWTKDAEFLKFIELPRRTPQTFELTMAACTAEAKQELENNGWRVRDAMALSDADEYRAYICASRGEFTVAKEQNIEFRSGWFSDRSASYLAAGRPVITQDTGFSNIFPTGAGLFGFMTMDDILAAVSAINSDYESHRRAAAGIARDYFSHDVVLGAILAHTGVSRPHAQRRCA